MMLLFDRLGGHLAYYRIRGLQLYRTLERERAMRAPQRETTQWDVQAKKKIFP